MLTRKYVNFTYYLLGNKLCSYSDSQDVNFTWVALFVGKLINLNVNRFGISFKVREPTYGESKKELHYKMVLRILHYLKGTPVEILLNKRYEYL